MKLKSFLAILALTTIIFGGFVMAVNRDSQRLKGEGKEKHELIIHLKSGAKVLVADTNNIYSIKDSICIQKYTYTKNNLVSDAWTIQASGAMMDTFMYDQDYSILYKIGIVEKVRIIHAP
jgi:hypothetical protein